MQTRGGEHVAADQLDQRRKARGAGADPVGQGRYIELDAFAGKRFALPVERLVLAELGVKDHRQQARSGPRSGNDMVRRRWLGDLLTAAATKLLARPDHLPLLARHYLEGLGDVLAQLDQLAAAARASARNGNDDALARQVGRQWRPHCLGARGAGLGLLPRRSFGGQRRLPRVDVVGQFGGRQHGPDYPIPTSRNRYSTTG